MAKIPVFHFSQNSRNFTPTVTIYLGMLAVWRMVGLSLAGGAPDIPTVPDHTLHYTKVALRVATPKKYLRHRTTNLHHKTINLQLLCCFYTKNCRKQISTCCRRS